MIVLCMEEDKGLSRPLQLIVEDLTYDYCTGSEQFFMMLEKYIMYQIRVKYYTPDGRYIRCQTKKILEVFKNKEGIYTIKLD